MKKWKKMITVLTAAAVLLSFTGCNNKGITQDFRDPTVIPTGIPITIYQGDSHAEFIIPQEQYVNEVTGANLVEALIARGVLDAGVALNSMDTVEENKKVVIYLDFNEKFQEQLQSNGSAGERILMGSVVNSFLEVFSADKVNITVNGAVPESGNQIYDEPQKKYKSYEETDLVGKITENGKKKKVSLKRIYTKANFSFNYDKKNFKVKYNKETETLSVVSKKKKKDGTPAAYLTIKTSETSPEVETVLMMKDNDDGKYTGTDTVTIGEDKDLFCGVVYCDKKVVGYEKTYYMIQYSYNNKEMENEKRYWKMETGSSSSSLKSRLQLTLDSLRYVTSEPLE